MVLKDPISEYEEVTHLNNLARSAKTLFRTGGISEYTQ